jgi:hypothetical protein
MRGRYYEGRFHDIMNKANFVALDSCAAEVFYTSRRGSFHRSPAFRPRIGQTSSHVSRKVTSSDGSQDVYSGTMPKIYCAIAAQHEKARSVATQMPHNLPSEIEASPSAIFATH